MVTLFDPEDPDCQRAVQEEDAEKMRQLYVALTRAKQRLYIPYPIDQEGKLSDVGEGSPLELLFARFAEPVQDLLASLSPHISFEVVEGDYPLKAIPIPSAPVLQPPEILPLPQANLRLLSFSALAKKGVQRAIQKPPEGDLLTPHHLPLGSETGVAIHSLFEKIFQRGLHTLSNEAELIRTIDREISSTALDRWKPVFFPWIRAILTHPLGAFSLSQLPPSQVQQEMEFHFSFPQGVMKGFADLFFEYQGKYYLLDWKSNYLGPSNTDYSEENMIAAMSENDYFLQARIYKEALSRYVKLFDNRPFDQLFGGAIYYFVRGVAPYCFIPTSFQEPPC